MNKSEFVDLVSRLEIIKKEYDKFEEMGINLYNAKLSINSHYIIFKLLEDKFGSGQELIEYYLYENMADYSIDNLYDDCMIISSSNNTIHPLESLAKINPVFNEIIDLIKQNE